MTASPYGRFADLGADGKPVRLGIMGGTFDPIHQGHLACAEAARCELGLAGVLFMPAAVPVYKLDQHVTSSEQRVRMVELAIQGNPHFQLCTIEVDRGGNTYTADTLRQMRDHFPDCVEFVFIAGIDAAKYMPRWKKSQEVSELARIAVVTRPGSDLSELGDPETLDGRFRASVVRMPELAISSSELRERVAQGKSIRYLVPDAVREYIEQAGLYQES